MKYFADGLRPLSNAPLPSEIRRVGTMLAKLADETVEGLKSHAEPISTTVKDLQSGLDSQHTALDAEAQAYGVLQAEKIAWLDAYRQDHNKLQVHFHDRPRKAEAYFRPAPRTTHSNPDDPVPGGGTPVTPPAAGAEPATAGRQFDAAITSTVATSDTEPRG